MKQIILIIVTLLFFSCQNERVYFYYDTGEVFYEKEKINKRKNYYRYYYNTGELFVEGMAIDSLEEGFWKGYYPDGTLMRKAFFHKGKVDNLQQIISEKKYDVIFEFENNPREMKVGNTYFYRVLTNGVWDFSIYTPVKLGLPQAVERKKFPLVIQPQTAGIDTIKFQILDSDGKILETVPYVITISE